MFFKKNNAIFIIIIICIFLVVFSSFLLFLLLLFFQMMQKSLSRFDIDGKRKSEASLTQSCGVAVILRRRFFLVEDASLERAVGQVNNPSDFLGRAEASVALVVRREDRGERSVKDYLRAGGRGRTDDAITNIKRNRRHSKKFTGLGGDENGREIRSSFLLNLNKNHEDGRDVGGGSCEVGGGFALAGGSRGSGGQGVGRGGGDEDDSGAGRGLLFLCGGECGGDGEGGDAVAGKRVDDENCGVGPGTDETGMDWGCCCCCGRRHFMYFLVSLRFFFSCCLLIKFKRKTTLIHFLFL